MFYTINKILGDKSITIAVRDSKEKAEYFIKDYIKSYIRKYDGDYHIKNCYDVDENLYQENKHYIIPNVKEIIVIKYVKENNIGYLYNYETFKKTTSFKISITEVHGVPDKSKNIQFSIVNSGIQFITYEEVLKELTEKLNK